MESLRVDDLVKLLASLVLVFSLSGCGEESGRFAISGNVSYDGQPITKGNIGFISTESDTTKSAGTDIVDGHYEIPRNEGPLKGSFMVVIYAERPSGRKLQADEGSTETVEQIEQYIPGVYNDRSTLTVEITGDRDDLHFDLEKQKQTKRRRRRQR